MVANWMHWLSKLSESHAKETKTRKRDTLHNSHVHETEKRKSPPNNQKKEREKSRTNGQPMAKKETFHKNELVINSNIVQRIDETICLFGSCECIRFFHVVSRFDTPSSSSSV